MCVFLLCVPEVGLEPTRHKWQEILSLSWLPITPLGHITIKGNR